MATENKVKKYDTLAIKSDDMALYSELFSSMLDMKYTEREGSYLGEHNTFDFDNNGKIDIIQNIEGEEQYDEDLKDYGLYVHVSNIVEQDKFIKKALKNKDVKHVSRHVYSSNQMYTYTFDEESDEFKLLSEELR